MNAIVTYKTRDEYMDFIRYNNTSSTAALIATSKLANFYEGGHVYELHEFYRMTDEQRPTSVKCTSIDDTKTWACIRLNSRSLWLYLPPLIAKGWISVKRPEAVTRLLHTADGWAWAKLNLKSSDTKRTFAARQSNNYNKQVKLIDEKIYKLEQDKKALLDRADAALQSVKKKS